MVYKSKKKNRKRYLKGSQKKMYGGLGGDNVAINNVNQPTLLSNLQEGQNLVLHILNIFAATGIKTIESKIEEFIQMLGMDTNADVKEEVKRILNSILKLKNALETEEGKQALSELEAILTKVSVEVVGPGVNKIADIFIEHSGKMAQNVTKAAVDAASVTPPLSLLTELINLFRAITSLAKNFSELADQLSKIVLDMLGKSEESRHQFSQVFSKINSAIANGNTTVSNVLNAAQNQVNRLNNYNNNIAIGQGQRGVNQTGVIQRGGLLNNYRRQAQMIGGRIRKSQLEFLEPYVKENSTKRNHALKRKTTLRKR